MEQEYHEMVLETVHESGAEEWYCPTCGRRFLMQWPPAYSKVILSEGDEYAIHSGGKGSGGLEISPIIEDKISQSEDTLLVEEDQERLQPWKDWFEQIDFESLWTKKSEVDGDK